MNKGGGNVKVHLSAFVRDSVLPMRECVSLEAPLTVREFLHLLERRHGPGVTEEIIPGGKLRDGYVILINGRFNDSLECLLNDEDEILITTPVPGG